MKSAFHKIAGGLFLVTDFLVLAALMIGCCFEEPKDVHPCAYAFAILTLHAAPAVPSPPSECARCLLMQEHIRRITGRG